VGEDQPGVSAPGGRFRERAPRGPAAPFSKRDAPDESLQARLRASRALLARERPDKPSAARPPSAPTSRCARGHPVSARKRSPVVGSPGRQRGAGARALAAPAARPPELTRAGAPQGHVALHSPQGLPAGASSSSSSDRARTRSLVP
jgi:hypothetical protein